MKKNIVEPNTDDKQQISDGEQEEDSSDSEDLEEAIPNESEEEVEHLSAEIDAINSALDKLEQQTDLMTNELRNILKENQKAREAQQQSNVSQHSNENST